MSISRSGDLSHNENNLWETSPDVDTGIKPYTTYVE